MPTKARHKCAACGNGVMTIKQPCTHCGAPDPLDPGPVMPAVIRCAQCGNPTHVAAAQCRKCRTASGSFVANAAAPAFRESAEMSRAAAEARGVAAAQGRPTSAGHPAQATPLAAPLWDPTKVRPESAAVAPVPPRRPPSEAAVVFPRAAESEPDPLAPPTAAVSNRIPCGRCGELQPRGTAKCVRCGVDDPINAESLARRKPLFGFVNVPTLPAVVTLLGLLGLGALTIYTHVVKEEQRKQRVWEALGSRASEEKVAALEKEAADIGVSTDVLLRIRFYCLHREPQRPSSAALRQTRIAAERDGRDPETAVSDAARGACGR